MAIRRELLDELMATSDEPLIGPDGLPKELTKALVERMLAGETIIWASDSIFRIPEEIRKIIYTTNAVEFAAHDLPQSDHEPRLVSQPGSSDQATLLSSAERSQKRHTILSVAVSCDDNVMTACTALIALIVGAVSLESSALAQNIGATPPPNLDASSIYSAFGFRLNDGPGTPAGDAVAGLQVGMRAAKLGLTSQSALDAWLAAQPLLVPTPPPAPLTGASVAIFNGGTASALNALLTNVPGGLFRITSGSITVDEPIRLVRAGLTLDLGAAQLIANTSLPYIIRVEGTHDVTVTGGVFTKGNSAILISKATNITVDHAQITGLTGNGVVVAASKNVLVTHNRISGLGGPGIFSTRRDVFK